MSLLLAIETSARLGSVALLRDGELIAESVLTAERRHDAQLLPGIAALLEQHHLRVEQLQGVAFGEGPGSFTGVRLAGAAAQGIGWAQNIPVYGISSLRALVRGVRRTYGGGVAVAVAIDARMGQVYWYVDGGTQHEADGDVRVLDAAALDALGALPAAFIAAGDGWAGAVLPSTLRSQASLVLDRAVPSALDVGALAAMAMSQGQRPAAGEAQPKYVRGADAWKTS